MAFAYVRSMTTRSRRLPFTLGSTVRAMAVATLAVAAAVSLKRSAARARGGGALPPDALMAGQWSAARLQNLAARDFHRLCAAYYQRRRFRLRGARVHGNRRDARLYFGTLPYPVAMVRAIACGGETVDVGAISDLVEAMSRQGIAKGIVHAPGGYTDAAMACARANRIRLVSGDDFGRNMAGQSSQDDETAVLQP